MPIDSDLQERLRRVLGALEMLLPRHLAPVDWRTTHAAVWRRHLLAGYLEPLPAGVTLRLADLLGIDEQKRVVERNTRQFLAGLPANNVLLWGTRGTGKSSLVRALLGSLAGEGLRVIQVDRDDLVQLPAIVEAVRGEPYRFLVFSDDVSFEVGESSYKTLKSALDGSVFSAPENVLIYVTSNRRHMLPEFETDNLGALIHNEEIHHGEAVEEKISLSGRFGLWVAFHSFNRAQYLTVARQWAERLAARAGGEVAWSPEAEAAAVEWALRKGDQSGRIALQFATHWVGSRMLEARDAG